MSRGYPKATMAPTIGRGARSVALTRAAPQLSLSGVAAAARRLPPVPRPPTALLLGLAGALALGTALEYLEDEERPGALGPGVSMRPRGYGVDPRLTYLETRHIASATYQSSWQVVDSGILASSTASSGPLPARAGYFWKPEVAYGATHGGWQKGILHEGVIYPGFYFGVSSVLKRYDMSNPTWFGNSVDVYRNDLPETLDKGVIERKPIPLPFVSLPDIPISRPVQGTRNIPAVITWPQAQIDPVRGIATVPGVGTQTAVMAPAITEVKSQASAATMRVLRRTIGQLGETFDYTRCFMYATGNTYTTRSGKERVIPKNQWADALASLGDAYGVRNVNLSKGRTDYRRDFSKSRGGNIITADNKVLTPEEVGRRLGECLAMNYFQDMSDAARSRFVSAVGAETGLTAGPLGPESLLNWLSGEMPYSGAVSFNL